MRKNIGCSMNTPLGCREQIPPRKKQKRIVLGLGPTLTAANIAHELRVAGWDVVTVATGEDARKAAIRNGLCVVAVPFLANDPLATAKVVNAMPKKSKVILVTPTRGDQVEQFAEMMGVPVVVEAEAGLAIPAAVETLLQKAAIKK